MAKQIRLGNCGSCSGFVVVDISGDTVSPLLDECRHCGEPLDAESVVDVPAVEAGADGARPAPICENCGARWSQDTLELQGDDLDGCPSCEPDGRGAPPDDV